MFCKNDECKVPLCPSCGLVDHRSHDLVDLSAAVDEIVADMQKLSSKVDQRNIELNTKLASLLDGKKTATDLFTIKSLNLKEIVQKLHNEIDTRYNEALSELEQIYNSEIDSLTFGIKSITSLSQQITSVCEFTNKTCDLNVSHYKHILALQQQIMDRLQELENTELPEITTNTADKTLEFNDIHQKAMVQIEKSLPNLCKIGWQKKKIEASPALSTIQFPDEHTAINQIFTATLQAKDCNGQPLTHGGDKVKAQQRRPVQRGILSPSYSFRELQVEDNNNGTYCIKYELCKHRYYNAIFIYINGQAMFGIPFELSVKDMSSNAAQNSWQETEVSIWKSNSFPSTNHPFHT